MIPWVPRDGGEAVWNAGDWLSTLQKQLTSTDANNRRVRRLGVVFVAPAVQKCDQWQKEKFVIDKIEITLLRKNYYENEIINYGLGIYG